MKNICGKFAGLREIFIFAVLKLHKRYRWMFVTLQR